MRIVSKLIFLWVCAVGPAIAQWSVGLELATKTYRGTAHDTTGSHVASHGRPGSGTNVGLMLEKSWRQTAAALRLSYAHTGFNVDGKDVSLTDKTTGRLLELALTMSTRVGGIGPSGAVRVEFGPALHLWDFDGEVHPRLGALVALSYQWLLVGRLGGIVRAEGTLSRSWFDATDVPPEFERRTTRRYAVGLGLRYRLSGE